MKSFASAWSRVTEPRSHAADILAPKIYPPRNVTGTMLHWTRDELHEFMDRRDTLHQALREML